jgi:hypothetical protein
MLVFYKLNSAIERGTKPDAVGWNPCHCTSTLKAAMVMDQLGPIGINDAEDRRGGQEGLRPVVMGREEPKKPGALGQAGEQGPIIARQPARERPVAPAFERVQQP